MCIARTKQSGFCTYVGDLISYIKYMQQEIKWMDLYHREEKALEEETAFSFLKYHCCNSIMNGVSCCYLAGQLKFPCTQPLKTYLGHYCTLQPQKTQKTSILARVSRINKSTFNSCLAEAIVIKLRKSWLAKRLIIFSFKQKRL